MSTVQLERCLVTNLGRRGLAPVAVRQRLRLTAHAAAPTASRRQPAAGFMQADDGSRNPG